MQHLCVYITAPDRNTAEDIARTLVQERLAACANIVSGMRSIYWWHGTIEEADEAVCLLKTTDACFAALEAKVRQIHPYETPCIVAMPITCGSAPFLHWIEEETAT